MSNEPKIAPELELISVDDEKLIVKVRSTADRLEDRLFQLQSEDAKTFAVREANKAGLHGAMVKFSAVMYGDSKKGVATNDFSPGKIAEPFLVVEVYSEDLASSRAIGDSQLPIRGM